MKYARAQAVLAAFGLSFAQLELLVTVDVGTEGTMPGRAWDSWFGEGYTGDVGVGRLRYRVAKGCSLGLGMERVSSRQVLKLYTCLSMDRIRPLFSNLVFLPV